MPTYGVTADELSGLENEWSGLDSDFGDFTSYRSLDGIWKQIGQGKHKPPIEPELRDYVQGAYAALGMLPDDLRIHKSTRNTNPTRFAVHAAGLSEQAKKVESNWKLYWSNVWTQELNNGRWLDEYMYEHQVELGIGSVWNRWCAHKDEDGTVHGSPIKVEKVLPECIRFKGNFRNPSVAWLKYSVSAVDADIKNVKGERPAYMQKGVLDSLGWVSEPLPEDFYANNAGQEIEVIVRDGEDPVAMCPLQGCYHKKRRICIYVCKKGGKVADYEKVEEYDSPFSRCSFLIVGGDVKESERDPHLIFRPSAWALYQIGVDLISALTRMRAMTRRELSDESSYTDPSGIPADTLSALTVDAEGGPNETIKKPEPGSREIPILPGQVRKFPGPTLDGLMREIDMLLKWYERVRPNPNLVGQMQVSEVAATVGQLQVQGAGVPIGPDLAHWDSGQVWYPEQIRHAIRFTSHFEPDGEKTKYVAMVTGKERVYGKRYSSAGEEVFLDAKMCEHDVLFEAITSKDTPSEQAQRRNQALTGLHEGVYVMEDVDEAWDIYDHETQEEKRGQAYLDSVLQPLEGRLIAAVATGRATAETGLDFGQLLDPNNIEVPGVDQEQTHLTEAANAATTMAPTVQPAPAGTPTGGSTGSSVP